MFRNILLKFIIPLTALIILSSIVYSEILKNGTSLDLPQETKTIEKTESYFDTAPTIKSSGETQGLMKKVESLQLLGEFNKANQMIKDFLAKNKSTISESIRMQLEFELERNKRIVLDYKLDENQLYSTLSKLIKDFSKKEFTKWQTEGKFDILYINGQKRFMNSSKSNLFFRYPELKKRRVDYNKDDPFAKTVLSHINKIKASTTKENSIIRLPHRSLMYQSLTLSKGVVSAGKDIRCWLPYPIVFESQDSVKLLSSSYPVKSLDKDNSTARSAFFEAKSKGNQSVKFDLSYDYTSYSYYREVDINEVQSLNINDDVFKKYTVEEPHVKFSEKMVNLANKITGTENNPYLKGKKIYDWICDNIKYSYAVEYSTTRNISEYTLDHRYGDCGQESLLFITLCRISAVPARWQSGFATFPGKQFIHDWAEIYIEPYGWIPVDTYMGIYFTSVTENLTGAQRKEIRDFYYGNIDYYRMVANKGQSQELNPEKRYFRSDNVDFQRGEIETSDRNLYFNEWTYDFKSE